MKNAMKLQSWEYLMVSVLFQLMCLVIEHARLQTFSHFSIVIVLYGVIHKPRGQDKVGGWLVKCPQLSTQGR